MMAGYIHMRINPLLDLADLCGTLCTIIAAHKHVRGKQWLGLPPVAIFWLAIMIVYSALRCVCGLGAGHLTINLWVYGQTWGIPLSFRPNQIRLQMARERGGATPN